MAVFLAMAMGCSQRPGTVSLWIVESGSEVHLDANYPNSDRVAAAPPRIELTAARNETVSFRFALRARDEATPSVDIQVHPITSTAGEIDVAAISLFRMHAVPLDRFPGWHVRSILPALRETDLKDVLVPVEAPMGGLPFVPRADRTYYFWADLAVPAAANSGHYATELVLTSGGSPIAQIDVRLEVFPFTLPDVNEIPVIAELDHKRLFRHHVRVPDGPYSLETDDWRSAPERSRIDRLLRSTMQMLRQHRLTPVLYRLVPKTHVDAHGRVLFDWAHYDATVAPFLNGSAFGDGTPLEHWPLPFYALLSRRPQKNERSSAAYQKWFRSYLAKVASHFEERGWLERSYALLPMRSDRPRTTLLDRIPGTQATRNLAAGAKAADERIRVVARLWPQDMAPYGWWEYGDTRFAMGHDDPGVDVDIWMPPGQFFDPSAMEAERQNGRSTWLLIDRPPFTGSTAIHAPNGHVRVLLWQARELGAQTLHIGCINTWPAADSPADPGNCVAYDPNTLLFPGAPFGLENPVPSVRLKMLRRSLQDAAYGSLLAEAGLEYVVATLQRSLASSGGTDAYRAHFADGRQFGWVENAELFDLARTIMARAWIDTFGGRRTKGYAESFATDATWRRFMLASRKVQLRYRGSRVRLSGSRTVWDAEIDHAVTVSNGQRVPLDGSLRLVNLPNGWASEEDVPLSALGPNSSRHTTLIARTVVPPVHATQPSNVQEQPWPIIELAGEPGTVHRVDAPTAFASAVRASDPAGLQIDGDLSDWPPGSVNVLSNFSLIASAGTDSAAANQRRPRQSTIAFVVQDSHYLYIAVNCEGAPGIGSAGRMERRNRVDYEDMIPVGTELVEILIDPLNSGTRSPGDLYHIAVKPSGSYLAERGVSFDPPCGASEPWPVALEVATGQGNGRWTAEIRIPLDALETLATTHTIWGFNVTRFEATNQEFSTWSGATGNAYEPLSLGNLYLP